jgi:hypothetical protein
MASLKKKRKVADVDGAKHIVDGPSKPVRITRNVPQLSVTTIRISACSTGEVPTLRLIGPPRSGFKFTEEEHADIVHAAPSIPKAYKPHRISVIDATLAYIVEDYIERVTETLHAINLKYASRELGAIANPGKGRHRAAADISEPVAHLLATRLLLRGGAPILDAQSIAAMVEAIRNGAYSVEQLQVVAREVRALGALCVKRTWVPGTMTNGPLWYLSSHVLEEWEFGMKKAPILSQDCDRNDGPHIGVHSELVRLTQALQVIGIKRMWAQGYETVDFDSRIAVHSALVRVRNARRESPSGNALRPAKYRRDNTAERAANSMKQISEQVADADRAARDWVQRGVSRRRRPRFGS